MVSFLCCSIPFQKSHEKCADVTNNDYRAGTQATGVWVQTQVLSHLLVVGPGQVLSCLFGSSVVGKIRDCIFRKSEAHRAVSGM